MSTYLCNGTFWCPCLACSRLLPHLLYFWCCTHPFVWFHYRCVWCILFRLYCADWLNYSLPYRIVNFIKLTQSLLRTKATGMTKPVVFKLLCISSFQAPDNMTCDSRNLAETESDCSSSLIIYVVADCWWAELLSHYFWRYSPDQKNSTQCCMCTGSKNKGKASLSSHLLISPHGLAIL